MNGSQLKKWGWPLLLAFLINWLVFTWIPLLFRDIEIHKKEIFSNPILLTAYHPPSPASGSAPLRQDAPQTTEPPQQVPRVSLPQKQIQKVEPHIDPKLPEPHFEIDPRLNLGMNVPPPPPPPEKPKPKLRKPKPEPKPKTVAKVRPKKEKIQQEEQIASPSPPSKTQTFAASGSGRGMGTGLGSGTERGTGSGSEKGKSSSPPVSLSKTFGLNEVDRAPQVLRKTQPPYPYSARRRNLTGKVVVKFIVDAQGHVRKPSIVEANPHGVFEKSVLETIHKWSFKPGYYRGTAVSTWVVLPIQFKLTDG